MEDNQMQPGAYTPSTFVNQGSEGSSKKVMMILIPVILVILILGGGFYFMSMQKPSTKQAVAPQPALQTADLSSELQSTQPSDVDADFTEIDKDLQSL